MFCLLSNKIHLVVSDLGRAQLSTWETPVGGAFQDVQSQCASEAALTPQPFFCLEHIFIKPNKEN